MLPTEPTIRPPLGEPYPDLVPRRADFHGIYSNDYAIIFGAVKNQFRPWMRWTNSHLHQFREGERRFSDPAFALDEFEDTPQVLDERKVTLIQVAPREDDELLYEYDFGDSWEHRVAVVKVLGPDPAAAEIARCLDGDRACPPEDCGGVWGYADLLKIIRNPRHKEHKTMLEWLGGPFDPEAFDLNKTNTFLRKLKWPCVTVGQLASVLMQRDGV